MQQVRLEQFLCIRLSLVLARRPVQAEEFPGITPSIPRTASSPVPQPRAGLGERRGAARCGARCPEDAIAAGVVDGVVVSGSVDGEHRSDTVFLVDGRQRAVEVDCCLEQLTVPRQLVVQYQERKLEPRRPGIQTDTLYIAAAYTDGLGAVFQDNLGRPVTSKLLISHWYIAVAHTPN